MYDSMRMMAVITHLGLNSSLSYSVSITIFIPKGVYMHQLADWVM